MTRKGFRSIKYATESDINTQVPETGTGSNANVYKSTVILVKGLNEINHGMNGSVASASIIYKGKSINLQWTYEGVLDSSNYVNIQAPFAYGSVEITLVVG